jgi:hypothetical protein
VIARLSQLESPRGTADLEQSSSLRLRHLKKRIFKPVDGEPTGKFVENNRESEEAGEEHDEMKRTLPMKVIAGGTRGFADGLEKGGRDGRFSSPCSICYCDSVGGGGGLLVADKNNGEIRWVSFQENGKKAVGAAVSSITTIPRRAAVSEKVPPDMCPRGICFDENTGCIFVADIKNHKIWRVRGWSSGRERVVWESIAGSVRGYCDGVGVKSQFNCPCSVVIPNEETQTTYNQQKRRMSAFLSIHLLTMSHV